MSIFDYELATFIPKRAIGSFNATVTIEESGRDEIEITQHPVQNGASISDHSFIKPSALALSVMWDASTAPLNEIYLKLIKLQRTREPMDVVTGKRIYKNMLIRAISQTTDATTENALKINLELQEVIITYLEVTSVPDRKKQATPAKTGQTQNTGTKSASTASAPRKRSALFALTRG
jgi:hypothetical protein